MKKFNFKLQTLLDLRCHKEKQEQDKFSKVLAEYITIENIVYDAIEKRNLILTNSQLYNKQGNIQLFYYRDLARKGLKTKMYNYNKVLKEKEIPLNKAREKLIESTKKKKVLEILKDKAFLKYTEGIKKEEQDELDEIGTNIYLKKLT